MKLQNLITARAVISKYAGEKLPAQIAYKFVKFIKHTDSDESFFNEKLRSILDQYAQKDENGKFINSENGNGIVIQPEKVEICKKEISELENTIIEIPFRFSLSEIDGLKVSMKDIFDLDELINEEK